MLFMVSVHRACSYVCIRCMFVLGIIHCQILEGRYEEARQQLEFQSEVQAGNPAVSDCRLTLSTPVLSIHMYSMTRMFQHRYVVYS
jgi:hypothetical protein